MSDKTVQNARPTGRSARFYAPLESEEDIQAIAQRIAQYCMAAYERGEADAMQISVQEASSLRANREDTQ